MSYFHSGLTPYTQNDDYMYFAHALYDPYRSRYYGTILVVIDESCFQNLYSDLIQDNNHFSVITEDGLIISDSKAEFLNSSDSTLLDIARKNSDGVLEYAGEKWIPSSIYNQYFDFYILQLTEYNAITSRVSPSIHPDIGIMLFCPAPYNSGSYMSPSENHTSNSQAVRSHAECFR